MRILCFLLLLPVVALAQPPGAGPQMDQQQFFEQTKKTMLPMLEESLPVMREARGCLQAAEDKDDLAACSEIMAKLQQKMLGRMGQPQGMPQGQQPPMMDPEAVEWDEETKQNTLKFLDRSILAGSAMQACWRQSGDMQQLQQCMQSKRPQP